MFTDTKGIIFRQVKTTNGRRMILLFTEKYGKISAGSNINEGRKGKSALTLRPFTYASYELYQGRNYFNINKGQVIKSFYKIGEDVDKYMFASYGLELCEKLLEEQQPMENVFNLTVDFLSVMEGRKSKFTTILLAYKINLLKYMGALPNLRECTNCGKKKDFVAISIKEGGVLCKDCLNDAKTKEKDEANKGGGSLIYEVNFDILSVLQYLLDNPLNRLEKLALDEKMEKKLNGIIDEYITFHLDPGKLKSENCLTVNGR